MHKIQERGFTLDDFSHEHLTPQSLELLEDTVILLNTHRALYNCKTDQRIDTFRVMTDECYAKYKKDIWWQMIQLLPSSYNQTRNVMMSYEVLANIYWGRKNHKLDEWRVFCDWIETLPYFELIKNTKPSMKEKIKAVFDKLISMAKDKERMTHYDTDDIPGWLEEVWEEEFENMEE